jgi:hypothetical protein
MFFEDYVFLHDEIFEFPEKKEKKKKPLLEPTCVMA